MERHPLHDKYPELHKSQDVQKSVDRAAELEAHKPATQPAEKLETWMDTLDKIHIGRDPKVAQRIKDIYHKQHVMQPGQVPEGYFETQRRIAREQGHGEVDIPDQVRAEMASTITRDQERSLDSWIDYLSSADAAYPMWFKYYTFRNIVKLADFDKEKGEFPKRSKSTTSIFPDINREALAYMADSLAAHYGISDGSPEGTPAQLNPDTKQMLDHDANFAKLYRHAIEQSQPAHAESLDVTDGRWIKYDQGSSGAELAATLQGYGTGWCTAGEGTAQMQLNMGDFYVYYSKDTQGDYKVPRVAIRMEQGEVAEVRGIEADQNLEGDLVEIAEAKLEDLPGAEAYKQKAADMARLTQIERELRDDPEADLSDADLRFLYELDHDIEGFGYERDPRIDEIRQARAGRDTERLKPLLLESIRQQADNAFRATNTIIERLNSSRSSDEQIPTITPEQFASTLATKWTEWQDNGSLDYVTSRYEQHGEHFTLLATPNVLAMPEQIMALSREFGQAQPYQTRVYEELYSLYSAEELSGNIAPDREVRLSIMPSKSTAELGYNNTARQQEILSELQADQPNLAVPSVLDDMVYWQSLRADRDSLAGKGMIDKTYIRHFDLEPKRLGGVLGVPGSVVYDYGDAYLNGSGAVYDISGRVLVR